ncbi:MAG: hypothetical protein KJO98_16725 [Rhodothermia bacterium]|nr:hypothetical protein [Rhodothermia bacterium]
MRLTPVLAAAAAFIFLTGCDSNDSDSFSDTAPPVISVDAFEMDANVFGNSPKSEAGANFAAAVLRVWPVSTIISANLIVPALVAASATQADPTFDGSWVWSNTVSTEDGTASFTLNATPDAQGIDWVMEVGLSNEAITLDDFELYTASTALDGKSGSWQLYYEFDGVRENVLTADFQVEDADTKTITFTVSGGPYEAVGDAVQYSTDGTARSFEWTQSSESKTHLVEWDSVTKAGSITATDYNGGGPACWDSNLDDAACPE